MDNQVSWSSSRLVPKDQKLLGILQMELRKKKQKSYSWQPSEKISSVQSISLCHGARYLKTPNVLSLLPKTNSQDSQKVESFLQEMQLMSFRQQAGLVEIAESMTPTTWHGNSLLFSRIKQGPVY